MCFGFQDSRSQQVLRQHFNNKPQEKRMSLSINSFGNFPFKKPITQFQLQQKKARTLADYFWKEHVGTEIKTALLSLNQ